MTHHHKRTLLPLSLTGVAVLAITACGNSAEESGSAETAESAEQENTEPGVEDVPALSEVEDPMWDSMLGAESVEVAVQGMELDGIPEDAEDMGLDLSRFTVSGAVQGSGVSVTFGEEERPMMLAFDEVGYIDAGMTFSMVEEMFGEMFGDEVDAEDLREEIDGRWMEFAGDAEGAGGGDDAPDVEELLDDMRDSWDSSESSDGEGDSDAGVSRESLSEEGAHDVRDGQDVWVYPVEDGPGEVVLQADHDTPRMHEATDGEQSLTFEQWDEAEVPERPEGDELITEEELDELVTESVLDQM